MLTAVCETSRVIAPRWQGARRLALRVVVDGGVRGYGRSSGHLSFDWACSWANDDWVRRRCGLSRPARLRHVPTSLGNAD